MSIAASFPVFEADQVLTNRHLNELVTYLEQQERLSRIKLAGAGIVCGLEIITQPGSITVTKGCGITSQGYLITQCKEVYTHYVPYVVKDFMKDHPNDLAADWPLISQCDDVVDLTSIPFYRDGFSTGIFQLLTQTAFDELDATDQQTATGLANTTPSFLNNYSVVLFLEAINVNLKNCDTNDCNDKGSRMEFTLRPLLVDNSLLDKNNGADDPKYQNLLHHVELRRYNVPVNDLRTAEDVLLAFAALVDNNLLKRLADDLSYCWYHYKRFLKDESSNPFINLLPKLIAERDTIMVKYPILIEYFYDFIDDLIKAFYEFKHKVFEVMSECCFNEMKFPFHLTLGEATKNTADNVGSEYRQKFIYSPLLDGQNEKLYEIRCLFTRVKLMCQEFSLTTPHDFQKKALTDFQTKFIKITPSKLGHVYLSDRCIPYYYRSADPGNELYRYWNYDKSRRGNAIFNLGYNASQYCNADPVVNPLLYDIESFNFFRTEGHIGKNINTALTTVKRIQQENNLPFEVIALSADYLGTLLRGEDPKCIIQDLESDYRVLVAELICRMHEAFCFVAKLQYVPQRSFLFNAVKAAAGAVFGRTAAAEIDVEPITTFDKSLLSIDLLQFQPDHPLVSSIVDEFQSLGNYKKGDTLRKLCSPLKDTIGGKYLTIADNFQNPVKFAGDNDHLKLYYYFFEFVDTTEALLKLLLDTELHDLDISRVKSLYGRITEAINFNHRLVTLFSFPLFNDAASQRNLNFFEQTLVNIFNKNIQLLNQACFIEKLEALKNEYQRRVSQYRLANNFNYYFKKHGGVEHKAGVPKGGTFILVYHEERRNRFADIRSFFVNKDLKNLLMTTFRGLLKTDMPLTEMQYSTKLLQVATVYRDPDLYVQFKDVMHKYLDECLLPEGKKEEIREIIDAPPPKKPNFTLADGMVIADFYVPYLCCSDCPPIAYILPTPPKEEVVKPTLAIEEGVMCSNSDKKFELFVKPPLGTFTVDNGGNEKAIETNGEKYFFVPKSLSSGSHVINYTLNGKSADPLQVAIVATPTAKFSFTAESGHGLVNVVLKNESTDTNNQTTYQWYFKGKPFDPPNLQFKASEPEPEVRLVASNGECPSEYRKLITFTGEVVKVKLSTCNNLDIYGLEPGITANDIVKGVKSDIDIDPKKLIVKPASLKLDKTTSFTIQYTLNDVAKEVELTVFVPDASFTIRIKTNENQSLVQMTLESINTKYKSNKWDFTPPAHVVPTKDPIEPTFTIEAIKEADGIFITHTIVEVNGCPGSKKYEIPYAKLGEAIRLGKLDSNTKL